MERLGIKQAPRQTNEEIKNQIKVVVNKYNKLKKWNIVGPKS